MLYFAVAIAIAFYGVLYFMWSAMQPHLQQPASVLARLRDMMFVVPDPTAMVLLKELIVLAVAYLVFDFVLSAIKRLLSRKPRRASVKDLRTVVVQQGRSTGLMLASEDSLRRGS
jgi:hypothetical protein